MASVQKVAIISDGFEGALCALALKIKLKHLNLQVTLLQSKAKPRIEHAFSVLRDFHQELGLPEHVFTQQAGAQKCLAIAFSGFGGMDDSYFCDSEYGEAFQGVMFWQWFLKFVDLGIEQNIEAFNPVATLLRSGKATDLVSSQTEKLPGGYLFDVAAYQSFLTHHAKALGVDVMFVERDINCTWENQRVHRLQVDGRTIDTDLVINASAAFPLAEQEKINFQSSPVEGVLCETVTASIDDLQARVQLSKQNEALVRSCQLKGKKQEQRFKKSAQHSLPLGYARSAWLGNVVHMGSASVTLAGVLTESNYVMISQLHDLMMHWPIDDDMQVGSQVFNQNTEMTAQRALELDIAVLSECCDLRGVECGQIVSIYQKRRSLFAYMGKVLERDHDIFSANLWGVLMWSLGVRPENRDPLCATLSRDQVLVAYEKLQKVNLSNK